MATLSGAQQPQATLKVIADRTGVSVTTVSRVLSGQAGKYRIRKATENSVRQMAKELDFVPNQIARGLRLKRTLTVGLIIPDIANPFFAGIAQQVTLGTRKHGYSVILCDSQDNTELEIESLGLLQSRNVEGVMLCPVGRSHSHLLEIVRGGLPMVLMDRFFPDVQIPYVSSDNSSGAAQAIELFIAHGHRHIACLQGLAGTSPNDLRVRGYKDALTRNHIPFDASLVVGDQFTEQSGYIETKLLLKMRPEVTALLALSNLNALGALRALSEEKRRIPEEISIISFDDQPYAQYLKTPMTTVVQSYPEMGDVAVKLLFDQIQSEREQIKGGILLPTTLAQRKSVHTLATRLN